MSSSAADSARRSNATGSGENRNWLNTSAVPAPISASTSRCGPAWPSATATVRIAHGRLTDRDPDAAQRDRDGHRGERGQGQGPVPAPKAPTASSPATMPTTTPTSSRTAFEPRSPREALSATTAATGAKNGSR
jgi:hypothetical protein